MVDDFEEFQNYLAHPLYQPQRTVYAELVNRAQEGKPSLLWAGVDAGKTMICRAVSHALRCMDQIAISREAKEFDRFYLSLADDHAHPLELPLAPGREDESMWHRIGPNTVVFIDDIFNIPDGEQLYNRICSITPHVIGMGVKSINKPWVNRYVDHFVGPYASWELNVEFDWETCRRKWPGGAYSFNTYFACAETTLINSMLRRKW